MNAIVLAAGNGDRFHNRTRDSKLLHPFLGQPLLSRTLDTARDAGVEAITVVLGYQADRVRALVERARPSGVKISFAHNPDWRLENGVSVLAARPLITADRFAVLMGDHVFEPAVLRRLLQFSLDRDESVLAVDARPVSPAVAAEATKVRRDDSRIVAIGKDLADYSLDTVKMFFNDAKQAGFALELPVTANS